MPLNLHPVPPSSKQRIPLSEISPDIQEAVEDAYAYCTEHPGERLETDPFESKLDAEDFLKQARSYAYQRATGRLTVTGNPAKGPQDGTFVARFSVAAYVGSETDELAQAS